MKSESLEFMGNIRSAELELLEAVKIRESAYGFNDHEGSW